MLKRFFVIIIFSVLCVSIISCNSISKTVDSNTKNQVLDIKGQEMYSDLNNSNNTTDLSQNVTVVQNSTKERNNTEDKNKLAGGILLETLKRSINPSLPEFIFKIYGDREQGQSFGANRIEIYENKGNQKLVQEITFIKSFAYNHMTFDGRPFGTVLEDINFDGYKDLRIEQGLTSHANTAFYYWLWDKKASMYIRNSELEEVITPTIDKKIKVVISNIRSSAAEYSELKYKFVNDRLTFVGEINHKEDIVNKVWYITVKELIGNEIKIVQEYSIQEDKVEEVRKKIMGSTVRALSDEDFRINYKTCTINESSNVKSVREILGIPDDFKSNNDGFISGGNGFRRYNLCYPNLKEPEISIIVMSDGGEISYIVGISLESLKTKRGLKLGDSLDELLKLYGRPNSFAKSEKAQGNIYELKYIKGNLKLEISLNETMDKVQYIFVNYKMEKSIVDQGI